MRIPILTWMRRYRRRLGGVLLPLLMTGWLGAAGPCAAMAATADGSGPDTTSTDHGHAAHAAAGQDHGAADADGDGHGHCPHCPGQGAGAPAAPHGLCAATDDATDSKRSAKPASPDSKAALPHATVQAAVADVRIARRRPQLYHRVFPPSPPLNLRYCVFIV